MIHLQGMGLVGAQLALWLDRHEMKFTWSDTDEPFTAWRASTGCVYPTKDDDIEAWEHLLTQMPLVRKHSERARWCYTSKNPPEGAKIKAVDRVGPITVSDATTIQVNVQRLVEDTREKFEGRRKPATPQAHKKDQIIVTHGSATAHHYVWGWSALVLLELDSTLHWEGERRPAIYLRKHYDLAYLYPQPNSQWFYGGTSNVVQRTPKHRDLDTTFENWIEVVEERTQGLVTVTDLKMGSLTEGWRPRPEISHHKIVWQGDDGVIYVRAQGGSGLRHFPRVAEAIDALL